MVLGEGGCNVPQCLPQYQYCKEAKVQNGVWTMFLFNEIESCIHSFVSARMP